MIRKILHVALSPGSANSLLEKALENCGFSYEVYSLGTEKTKEILYRAFAIPKSLSDYDFVITSEYFTSFAINLRLLAVRAKAKHVAVGLNQSRRLLKANIQLADRLVNYVFRRTDLVIVHSRREAELFHKIHDIPPNKFHFSPWGYDLPTSALSRFATWPKQYVCSVGRNNRDIDTFIQAVADMNIDGILITSSHQSLPEKPLPPNVYHFVDLPQSETLGCIENAIASVVLLKDNERGAGHITVVTGMLAGTPQIVSDVDIIKDYVIAGVSAIAVPLGDVQAVRMAIQKLIEDPTYALCLTRNAKDYADRWLTNCRVTERIVSVLDKLARGREVAPVDPDWLSSYKSFAELYCPCALESAPHSALESGKI